MKKLSKNKTAGGIDEPLRLATAAAQHTKKRAVDAQTKLDAAKARFKQAKNELKQAKKNAKKTAKRARVAQEELEAWIEKAARQRLPQRSTPPAPVKRKPARKPVRKQKPPGATAKTRPFATVLGLGRPAPSKAPEPRPNPIEERPTSGDMATPKDKGGTPA